MWDAKENTREALIISEHIMLEAITQESLDYTIILLSSLKLSLKFTLNLSLIILLRLKMELLHLKLLTNW